MFVTLEDFFNNYRIKNQQQPNETVLNRGMMRLKRETRELKSLLDILLGNDIELWDINRIYEKDEYIQHNDLIFKSKVNTNYQNEPFRDDVDFWEVTTIETVKSGAGKINFYEYSATEGQTVFTTPFNMEGTPMIFIDGILLKEDQYSKTSNIDVVLTQECVGGEVVAITSGISFDTNTVLPKQQFTSTSGQTEFICDFDLKSPSVFVDGLLTNQTSYTWANNILTLNTGLTAGKVVTIGNGNILGNDLYSKSEIDTLLDSKMNTSDSYTSILIDNLLMEKSSIDYVDTLIGNLDASKSDKSTTLSGYGITNAYTKSEVDSALSSKIDSTQFTGANVLSLIKTVDGSGSGLDADTLDNLSSWYYLTKHESNNKFHNLEIVNATDIYASELNYINRILFDVDSTEPNILIRKYDESTQDFVESKVYTDNNTSNVMIIKEGYFKGVWLPKLDTTFGVSNWSDYNWTVTVTPTITGYENSYSPDNTPYGGFDNQYTWDENHSEYHYGFVSSDTVNLRSLHKVNSTLIEIPSRYHLVGVLKTFSSYQTINQI